MRWLDEWRKRRCAAGKHRWSPWYGWPYVARGYTRLCRRDHCDAREDAG